MFKYVSKANGTDACRRKFLYLAVRCINSNSFQIALVFFIFAYASAKPQLITPLAYSTAIETAPFASGALISREFHGNTSPYVATLPYTAAAYTAALPYIASSPYSAAYSPSVYLR